MGLANLEHPAPGDEGWQVFWFNNWIDHQGIQQAIQKKTGANQVIFVIDPWVSENADAILQRHQEFHNNMNSALKLDGQDLSQLNFKDQSAVRAWLYVHFQEHLSAHQALGI